MNARLLWISITMLAVSGGLDLAEHALGADLGNSAVREMLYARGDRRIIESEKIKWSEEIDVTVVTWRGLVPAKVSFCRYTFEFANGGIDSESVRLLYLPSAGYYHIGDSGSFSQNVSNCFLFREGLLVFGVSGINGVLSTNKIPAGKDQAEFVNNLKRDFLRDYPNDEIRERPSWRGESLGDFLRFFGNGRITIDQETGTRKILRKPPGGFPFPKVLSIGTDGTNAVVAYDKIEGLSEDRPVLTLDSKFQVVRAELDGQPLILNRTNNIYVRREEDRQRVETNATPK
jgi:hypothetical protein